MVVGALTVGLWIAAGWSSWLYEIVPGFILASLATWLVSLASPGPTAEIDIQFDAAAQAAKGA
jgi:Na+/proline symporter